MTILPTAWLFVTSMTAGWQKIFHEKPSIGFLAQAKKFSTGIEQGTIIAPAKSLKDMETIVFSNQINAALCGFFMLVAVTMLIAAFFAIRRALRAEQPTAHEVSAPRCERRPAAAESEFKINGRPLSRNAERLGRYPTGNIALSAASASSFNELPRYFISRPPNRSLRPISCNISSGTLSTSAIFLLLTIICLAFSYPAPQIIIIRYVL